MLSRYTHDDTTNSEFNRLKGRLLRSLLAFVLAFSFIQPATCFGFLNTTFAADLSTTAQSVSAIDDSTNSPVSTKDEAPTITTSNTSALPDATIGTAYWDATSAKALVTFKATGYPTPTWYLTSKAATSTTVAVPSTTTTVGGVVYWIGGGLPSGLRLNPTTGELSGTPVDDGTSTYPCTYTFTLAATNDVLPDATRVFTITVNKPVVKVAMPDLSGMSESAVMRTLMGAGLTPSIQTQNSDTVTAGVVISQDPVAGTSVVKGSTAKVVISSGPIEPQPPRVLSLSLYAYSTDSYNGYVSRLGDNGRDYHDGAYWVPGGITEKDGSIRLCAAVELSDGTAYYQCDDNWPDDVSITYQTSDPSVAVVSSKGVVVATGDGTATITATAPNGKSSSMKISVIGQSDPYPVEVQVTDECGNDYGDACITFSTIGTTYQQLYARVVYSDGSSTCNAPYAIDYNASSAVFSTIAWSTSNTETGYVDTKKGRFIPRGYGSLNVYATVTGGDPNTNSGQVRGYVRVVIDSGEYSDDLSSDALNIRVVYKENESYTAYEKTYTVDELRAIQNVESTYTFTKADGAYVTASARGIYLTTLLNMVDVDVDDLYQIELLANDKNPGPISADFLFRARYYFPNYEFGNNTMGATLVYAMLAYESDWRDSTLGATNCDENYSALDGGTCLRMMFGSVTLSDMSTSKSWKYTKQITFILKGSPPAGEYTPIPDSTLLPGSDGQTTGEGETLGLALGGQESSQEITNSSGGASSNGASSGESEKEWHIYQMMSTAKTSFDLKDWSDPLIPWAIPFAIVTVALGGMMRYLAYREQKRWHVSE